MDIKFLTWKCGTVPIVLAWAVGWILMVIPDGKNAEGRDIR